MDSRSSSFRGQEHDGGVRFSKSSIVCLETSIVGRVVRWRSSQISSMLPSQAFWVIPLCFGHKQILSTEKKLAFVEPIVANPRFLYQVVVGLVSVTKSKFRNLRSLCLLPLSKSQTSSSHSSLFATTRRWISTIDPDENALF